MDIFDNAVASITLGIEDFCEGTDARMLSAARNYYAELLLLGKECLVPTAPDADPMEVIGAKFEPVPDGDGGPNCRVRIRAIPNNQSKYFLAYIVINICYKVIYHDYKFKFINVNSA